MAGFLTTTENLVQCSDFSITPATSENALGISMPSMVIDESFRSVVHVNDPISRVVLRLQWLDQLEKQADKLSLYTNKAYYSVGEAYRNAVEVSLWHVHRKFRLITHVAYHLRRQPMACTARAQLETNNGIFCVG